MITVYRIHHPYQGTYSDADNIEQAKEHLAKAAWSAYMTLCHGMPLAEVTINVDGSQTWKSSEPITGLTEEEIQAQIVDIINKEQLIPLTITENKNG